jgi:hypothetical protein
VCDVGTFGNVSELLDCHLCPPGTHQDVSGQASCLPCIRKCCLLNDCKNRTQQLTTPPPVNNTHFYFTTTAGRFNTQFNQTTCKECQVDTYSPLSSHDKACVDCPNGYEASIQSSSCTICAAGKAGTPCTGCSFGQFRGSNDLPTSCIDCPSGFYQGAEDSASCLACTPGQYQLGVGSTNCKVCDVGTFGNVSELLDCHLCPPGTHQDVSGQASCLPCIRKCCL